MRSLFFTPANRPDLIQKFTRFDADGYVIDLEAATPAEHKLSARASLAESVAKLRAENLKGKLMIRVNSPTSPHYLADLDAVSALDIDGIVIPMLESADQLFPALHRLDDRARTGRTGDQFILAGIETARGVINAVPILDADRRVSAVYFGAHDFMASMRGRITENGQEVLYARSKIVLAARAAGAVAIDQAVAEIRDDERFLQDSEVGRTMGYDGKLCLIPKQVELANRVFSPTQAEVETARRMVAAFELAASKGIGTIDFEGQLLDDGPLLKSAKSILALHERLTAG